MNRSFFFAIAFAFVLNLTSCSTEVAPDPITEEPTPAPAPDPEPEFEVDITKVDHNANRGLTNFSLDFLRFAMKDNKKNVLISPTTLSNSLAIFANGGDDKTRDGILRALNIETGKEGLERMNEFWKFQTYRLPQASEFATIIPANSLWIKPGYEFQDEFLSTAKEYFKADVFNNHDLSNMDGVNYFNEWVNQKTSGMIPRMLSEPLSDFVASATSTLYFKSIWYYPFDEEDTKKGEFTNSDGSVSMVDYMWSESMDAACDYKNNVVSLELPYGYDNVFSFFVAMPDENINIDEFISSLNEEKLAEISYPQRVSGDVKIPKFMIETACENLTDFLSEKTGGDICSNGVFSRMIKGDADYFKLNNIVQKNKIMVNEKGTEAASSTTNKWGSGFHDFELLDIEINRPFVFWITDIETGIILFIGAVKSL